MIKLNGSPLKNIIFQNPWIILPEKCVWILITYILNNKTVVKSVQSKQKYAIKWNNLGVPSARKFSNKSGIG